MGEMREMNMLPVEHLVSPLGTLAERGIGLYILRRVWNVNGDISVVISQIITKFGECVG